jgi:hypothetical protein
MQIYFVIFLYAGFLSIKGIVKLSVLNSKLLDYLLLMSLICFVGFRYNCDNDYHNYAAFYQEIPPVFDIAGVWAWSYLHSVEFGYVLMCAFLKTLGFGYQSIFMFCSIITFTFLYMAFKRLIKYSTIALFGFFAQYFTLLFVQMRFGVATAISIYALSFLQTKNKKNFWFFFSLALLFHLSALGILGTYCFYKINWLKKIYLIPFVLLGSLLSLLIPIKNLVEPIMSSFGGGRYASYLKTNHEIGFISLLYTVILIIPLILFRKKLVKKQVNVNLFLSMAIASVSISILVGRVEILNRFSLINSVVLCMVLPLYFLLIKQPINKVIWFCLIILYSYLKFLPSMQWISEYTTIFSFGI